MGSDAIKHDLRAGVSMVCSGGASSVPPGVLFRHLLIAQSNSRALLTSSDIFAVFRCFYNASFTNFLGLSCFISEVLVSK